MLELETGRTKECAKASETYIEITSGAASPERHNQHRDKFLLVPHWDLARCRKKMSFLGSPKKSSLLFRVHRQGPPFGYLPYYANHDLMFIAKC